VDIVAFIKVVTMFQLEFTLSTALLHALLSFLEEFQNGIICAFTYMCKFLHVCTVFNFLLPFLATSHFPLVQPPHPPCSILLFSDFVEEKRKKEKKRQFLLV
jgi:hypothetical protein